MSLIDDDYTEQGSYPLLNIEQSGSTLKITLNATGACQLAEGYPLGIRAFMKVLRVADMM